MSHAPHVQGPAQAVRCGRAEACSVACGKDRWASEWHLVFHQLALQLSGPVRLHVRRRLLSLADAVFRAGGNPG